MAVAGTALGLDVRLDAKNRWVTYNYRGVHSFCTYGMRFPIDSPVAIEQANDKVSARMRMLTAGVQTVPFSVIDGLNPSFPAESGEWALKGAFGKQGRGVVTRISTEQLAAYATHLASSCRTLLLEPTMTGPAYRFLVLEGEVIDAYKTVPPCLTGDGKHTVRELFDIYVKNISRSYDINPEFDFEVKHSLRLQGLNETDVVEDGREFCPSFISNISRGGSWIPVEAGQEFNKYARIACEAAAAVDLRLCGVDLIESSDREVFVLESNPSPGVARFTWPWRPDFKVESINLRVPILIIQAVLRAVGVPKPVAHPDLTELSIDEFNRIAIQIASRSNCGHA
jgi:hypothetical protein